MNARVRLFKPSTDLGHRPAFEWLSLGMLHVDESYQRDIRSNRSRAIIRRIVEEFRWENFQPPTVSARGDGSFAVIDGQHRVEAARLHPEIREVPCCIVKLAGVTEEARSFVTINKNRKNISSLAVFFARLAADDPAVIEVSRICDAARVKILKSNPPHGAGQGQTIAVGRLLRCLKDFGPAHLENALIAINEAAEDGGGYLFAGMIEGVARIYACYGADDRFDPDRLIETIGQKPPEEWRDSATSFRKFNPGGVGISMQATILNHYNRGLHAATRLDPLPSNRRTSGR